MNTKNHHYQTAGLIISYLLKICIVSIIIISIYQQQWVYIFGGVVALTLSLIPTILKRNYQITLPLVLDILIVASLLLHIGGGLVDAYHTIPNYDSLAHFTSAFFVAFLSFVVIYTLHIYWASLKMDKYAMALLVVFCTIAFGVVWEFNEWVSDLVFHTFEQWGYTDTIKDLAINALAGTIMAIIGVSMIKKGSFDTLTEDFSDQIDKKIIQKLKERHQKKKEGKTDDGSNAKQDIKITLPLVFGLLFVLATILHVGGFVLGYYVTIPGYQLMTRLFLSFLVAFVSLTLVYGLDQHWEGLKMNKYAMAFFVVISTISFGVIFEFVKFLNITGIYYVKTNLVLMLNLTADTIAGMIIAILGVYLIKSGYFDVMTGEFSKQINDWFLKKEDTSEKKF